MKNTKSLKGNINFKRVLSKNNRISSKNLVIYIKKSSVNNEINLLGICVSKKHGNSVVRNRLKRWAREGYYSIEENIKTGYDIIILFKKDIDVKNINYFTIKDEISSLIYKSELFYEKK